MVKRGKEGLSPDEVKVLTVSNDATAGYLAPPEYVRELIKGIIEYSPVRSLARVRTTTQRSVQVPKEQELFQHNGLRNKVLEVKQLDTL